MGQQEDRFPCWRTETLPLQQRIMIACIVVNRQTSQDMRYWISSAFSQPSFIEEYIEMHQNGTPEYPVSSPQWHKEHTRRGWHQLQSHPSGCEHYAHHPTTYLGGTAFDHITRITNGQSAYCSELCIRWPERDCGPSKNHDDFSKWKIQSSQGIRSLLYSTQTKPSSIGQLSWFPIKMLN